MISRIIIVFGFRVFLALTFSACAASAQTTKNIDNKETEKIDTKEIEKINAFIGNELNLIAAGNFDEAIKTANDFLSNIKEFSKHKDLAISQALEITALSYIIQEQFKKAESPAKEACEICANCRYQLSELSSPFNSIDQFEFYLAYTYFKNNKFSEAKRYAIMALNHQQEAKKDNYEKVSNTLNLIIYISGCIKDYPEAEAAARRLLAMQERRLGADSPDLVKILNILSYINKQQHDRKDAAEFKERAKRISRSRN